MSNNNRIITGIKSILIENTTVYDPNAVIYRYVQKQVNVLDAVCAEEKIQSYIQENTQTQEEAQNLFDRAVQDYEEKKFGNAPTSKMQPDAVAARGIQSDIGEPIPTQEEVERRLFDLAVEEFEAKCRIAPTSKMQPKSQSELAEEYFQVLRTRLGLDNSSPNAERLRRQCHQLWYGPNLITPRLEASKEIQESFSTMLFTPLFDGLIQKLIKTGKIANLLSTDSLAGNVRDAFEGKVARSITGWLMEPKYCMTFSDTDIVAERNFTDQVYLGSYGKFVDMVLGNLSLMVGNFKEWAKSSQVTYGQFFVGYDCSYDWSDETSFIVVDLLEYMDKCVSKGIAEREMYYTSI